MEGPVRSSTPPVALLGLVLAACDFPSETELQCSEEDTSISRADCYRIGLDEGREEGADDGFKRGKDEATAFCEGDDSGW